MPPHETPSSIARIALGLLALLFTATFTAAAEEGAARERKPFKETLAKYDANKDGKLDETEKAAMKADEEAVKAAKKAEKEARKAEKEAEKK